MDAILELGISIVLFIQGLGDWLLVPMQAFTFLGNEEFYLFVAPAIFWCWDSALGLRMGLALMVSGSINGIMKLAFTGPRPFWYDARVGAHAAESSFGVPSGHSQNAVVVWGTLAAWFKRPWAWVAAAVIAFLIGISRMYLGVHFPHDVLLGWLFGALILWAILAWEKPFMTWFKRFAPFQQVLFAFLASLVFIAIGALLRLWLDAWTVPAAWMVNVAEAFPDAEPIDPLALSGLITNTGAFFGLATGGILVKIRGGFDAGGPAWQRAVRFVVGLVGVLAIYFGLGLVFPRGESLLPYILRYIRYGFVGFWISGLAPLLFIQLRLAKPMKEA